MPPCPKHVGITLNRFFWQEPGQNDQERLLVDRGHEAHDDLRLIHSLPPVLLQKIDGVRNYASIQEMSTGVFLILE
jgi:hypothetical protein